MNRNTVAKIVGVTAGVGVVHIVSSIVTVNVPSEGLLSNIVVTTGKIALGVTLGTIVHAATEKTLLEAAAALKL